MGLEEGRLVGRAKAKVGGNEIWSVFQLAQGGVGRRQQGGVPDVQRGEAIVLTCTDQCQRGHGRMKKEYTKPSLQTESVFETLAGGCTLLNNPDPACNPGFDGTNLTNYIAMT